MTPFVSKLEIDLDFYDISVQRWPFPWMTRYRVRHHDWLKDETRLLLVKENGDSLQFTRMDRRATIVHANHRLFVESHSVNLVSAVPDSAAVVAEPTTTVVETAVVAEPPPNAAPIESLAEESPHG